MYKQFLLRLSFERVAVELKVILDFPVSFCRYRLSYLWQSCGNVHELWTNRNWLGSVGHLFEDSVPVFPFGTKETLEEPKYRWPRDTMRRLSVKQDRWAMRRTETAVFKYSVRVPFWTIILVSLWPYIQFLSLLSQNRDVLVGVVTRMQVGWPTEQASIPGSENRYFYFPKFQPTSKSPSGFISGYCQKFSAPRGKVACAWSWWLSSA